MKRRVPRVEPAARVCARGELLGLPCVVTGSSDLALVGLEGLVVDETLRTVTLRCGGRDLQLSKPGSRFTFATSAGPIEIEGRAIEFRPEDRPKKVR